MQSLGEVMGTVLDNAVWPGDKQLTETTDQTKQIAEECKNCGTIVPFATNQWSRSCPGCGMYISIHLPKERTAGNQPACTYGCSNGLIVYQSQANGQVYEYAARCLCKAGMDRPEIALPFIDDVKNAPRKKLAAG